MKPAPLPAAFYHPDAVTVARNLLGTTLVRRFTGGSRITGQITETEAYVGESDLACHARAGRTKRTEVMYGPPGRAYMYLIYGLHWMLNCVTGEENAPAAVLIRALWPMEGLEQVARNRARPGKPPVSPANWTNGPARLCQALLLDGTFNGTDLTDPESELIIMPGMPVDEAQIQVGPRVGIENVPEPWRSMPWRFQLNDANFSKPPK